MQIGEKMESLQVPAGYGVTFGVGTVPIWAQEMSGWLQFGAVVFAFLIGATTLYLNLMRIMDKRRKRKYEE